MKLTAPTATRASVMATLDSSVFPSAVPPTANTARCSAANPLSSALITVPPSTLRDSPARPCASDRPARTTKETIRSTCAPCVSHNALGLAGQSASVAWLTLQHDARHVEQQRVGHLPGSRPERERAPVARRAARARTAGE